MPWGLGGLSRSLLTGRDWPDQTRVLFPVYASLGGSILSGVADLGLSPSRTLGFVLVLFFSLFAVPDGAGSLVHEIAEG